MYDPILSKLPSFYIRRGFTNPREFVSLCIGLDYLVLEFRGLVLYPPAETRTPKNFLLYSL
jgi:hypothetical protein